MSTLTDEEWSEYKSLYDKTYANEAEDKMRRGLVAIAKHVAEEQNSKLNSSEVSFIYGINQFSDKTDQERNMKFPAVILGDSSMFPIAQEN